MPQIARRVKGERWTKGMTLTTHSEKRKKPLTQDFCPSRQRNTSRRGGGGEGGGKRLLPSEMSGRNVSPPKSPGRNHAARRKERTRGFLAGLERGGRNREA